jgi:hypothetical protein
LRAARSQYEVLLGQLQQARSPDHPLVQRTQRDLAAVLSELGDLRGARALQQSLLESYGRTLPPDHPDVVEVLHGLAGLDEQSAEGAAGLAAAAWADLDTECRAALLRAADVQRTRAEQLTAAQGSDAFHRDEAWRDLAALLRVLGRTADARQIEDRLEPRAALAAGGLADAAAAVAASAERSATSHPPEVTFPAEHTVVSRRHFEVAATVRALSGIHSVSIRQDGRVLANRPTSVELQRDPGGRSAELRFGLEIPAGRSLTLITVWVTDLRGVASPSESLIVRYEPGI